MGPGRVEEGDAQFELVHTDSLRFWPELTAELGGDPDALLRHVGIDPPVFSNRGSSLLYRSMAELLEHSAAALRCPDFGMRLARLQGGGGKVFGPVGIAVRNSRSLGEALDCAAKHIHAFSPSARTNFEHDRANQKLMVEFEILSDRLPNNRQAMEQVMLVAQLHATGMTGGKARVREVLFRHQPLSLLRAYRDYFGCDVRFDQRVDAVVFREQDLLCPIVDPDIQLYEMATSFIDTKFARVAPPVDALARCLILQHLGSADCTKAHIAAELGLHPRTLHRRLKVQGKSFEGLKDEVRRDVALRYLQQLDLPLTRITERLGYAETSVLSRSCFRWFGASPRQLRSRTACSEINVI
jgi:AraC-like DNA-binding protein